jgi:hypothetical protein
MLNAFMKLQKNEVSLSLHCIIVPNIPKIPEPIIPPFPEFVMLDCLGIIYL